MTTRRIGIVAAGGAVAVVLLIGATGSAVAQDPGASAQPSGWMMGVGQVGPGMMGGQAGGMMGGGQVGPGMMGGQPGSMMGGGQMGAMMGGLSAAQLERMQALHDEMISTGQCDPADMLEFHQQLQSER